MAGRSPGMPSGPDPGLTSVSDPVHAAPTRCPRRLAVGASIADREPAEVDESGVARTLGDRVAQPGFEEAPPHPGDAPAQHELHWRPAAMRPEHRLQVAVADAGRCAQVVEGDRGRVMGIDPLLGRADAPAPAGRRPSAGRPPVAATRQGDVIIVKVSENERYDIPDAFGNGG
jgi:hypothetical protein